MVKIMAVEDGAELNRQGSDWPKSIRDGAEEICRTWQRVSRLGVEGMR